MNNIQSIAVLPFVNISSDSDNEYFCDGITEEIINALTKVKGLKVIARTSSFAFKNHNVDVRQIGNQLSVSTILEGSIRIFNDSIRINTQLIRTNDGFQIWSQNFDRKLDHIFELQDEISLIIAEQIRENFGHLYISNHISIIGTKNISAYKLYLKGRAYQLNWVLEDYIKAIDYYKKSIEIDNDFYDAYFTLSRSYGILSSWGFIDKHEGVSLAKIYLNQGLKINSSSYLACFSQSSLSFWNDWNYAKGIDLLKNTLHKNPNYAIAYEGIAEIHMATNQLEKALLNINKAIEISPLSPNHLFTKGNIYFLRREYTESIKHLDQCLKIDPNFSLAIETKLACYILLKDTSKFESYVAIMPQLISPKICEALFSLMNKTQLSKAIDIATMDVEEGFKNIYPWHFYLLIHSGNKERALDIFEDKMKLKVGQLVNFQLDPFLDPLREDERYLLLAEQFTSSDLIPAKKDIINQVERETIKPFDDPEIKRYKLILENFINTNKPFLNPNLSLKELGKNIELHPNKLSWLLNAGFNKNFNDFINQYRLNHFKTIALDPKNSHLTILGLAYDSGFNSKSVFNTYFKKIEGITPRAWMKCNLK